MNPKNRLLWLTLTALIVIALSAMYTVPAYADDDPPATPVVEEPAPPTDESALPTDEPSVVEEDSPQVDQVPLVAEPTLPTEDVTPLVEEATPSTDEPPVILEESAGEILAQVPQGTEVVVVDENGDALPFASQEVEDAILSKDPIWCPTGVAPKPGIGGCSASFGSLSLLVAGFVPPAKSGTIWIESGTDAQGGGNVLISGSGTWATAANYSLTLQGGWIGGTTGSKSIVGVSLFDSAINIVGWNGAVTINDIAINGAANAYDPFTGALNVRTKGNIVLSNVTVTNTVGAAIDGAYLDNLMSTTQASVVVKNSTFNENNYHGLNIKSNGTVTLTNVTANENNGSGGVSIYNSSDTSASAVTVTNGFFNRNSFGGLYVNSNGAVKLSQISANQNDGYTGVYVDNTAATTAQVVTVTGFLTAFANDGNGLYIRSDGVISLTNLTTNDNLMAGTDISNTTATLPAAVTLSGTNVFNSNLYEGLHIDTKGAVTTNNITAMWNGATGNRRGVWIDNLYDIAIQQNVTMNGNNVLHHNSNTGLYISSYGTVTTNNITASYNGTGNGVSIGNTFGVIVKPITLKGTNLFFENGLGGLEVFSSGAITVNNITSYYNGTYGAALTNQYGFYQNPITITGYGVFEHNGVDGLKIDSNGAITTTNLTINRNDNNGVVLNTIGITKPQAVTLKGNNSFTFNGLDSSDSGLVVNSDGNITVNNLYAVGNFSAGAQLNNFTNWDAPATNFTTFGSITLTGFGNLSGNGGTGLHLYTHGAATISNMTATNNSNDGIRITAHGKVTLSCIMATNNTNGIVMYSTTPLLTIKGLISFGNTNVNETLLATTTVRTRCP